MKGLIIKNAMSLYRQNEMLIIMLLLFNTVFITILPDFSFMAAITMLFSTILVQNQMSDENKSGYSEYERSLPLTYKHIVISRYIFGFGFSLTAAAVSVTVESFISFIFDIELGILSFAASSFLYSGVAFVILCLLLPVYYAIGTKPVPILNVLIILIPTVINYIANLNDRSALMGDFSNLSALVIVVVCVSAAVVNTGSVLLSLRIYRQVYFNQQL